MMLKKEVVTLTFFDVVTLSNSKEEFLLHCTGERIETTHKGSFDKF